MFFSITTNTFLTTGSKLQHVPSIFACLRFTLVSSLGTQVLQKSSQGNFGKFQVGKFQVYGESRFGGSEKDRHFLKISKWQHNILGITSEESWLLIS